MTLSSPLLYVCGKVNAKSRGQEVTVMTALGALFKVFGARS